ncbi:hypothetical protein O0Q50_22175 [Priestia aryabhattai]|uniref:Uncharacterized protein n=1 Tax=Priestia aryabhattai TaxID=412384 RepID=A0AAX6NDA9_PRIAR|nr:hypothetical protein [Priestia aryabhattai]MDU9693891.1 hypothetical protein [Priestia aryabhattai]
MEEKVCGRCGEELKDTINPLCKSCQEYIDKAIQLIETDPAVDKYYAEMEKEQQKAEIVLEKLKYKYYNGENSNKAASVLKSTGKGLKKLYKFNVLELGIDATKNLLMGAKGEREEVEKHQSEEELLIQEIMELEEFINTDPIEFVIYDYILTDEEKGLEKIEEEQQEKNANFLTEPVKSFTKEKFNNLDRTVQLRIAIVITVILMLLFIGISLI